MTDVDIAPQHLNDYEQEFSATLAVDDAVANLLFREARTAYSFTDRPVTAAEMRTVYDLIKWGPTAMNSQPLRLVLVQSPEARAELVTLMAGNNKSRTEAAPLVALLAADADFHDELPRVFPAVPNARDMFADEQGRVAMAHTNAVLQAGYFLLGVRAAGLAAGPMAGFDAEAVSRTFFPDGRHRVFMVVNLGHVHEESYRPRQPRLDFDEVVTTV